MSAIQLIAYDTMDKLRNYYNCTTSETLIAIIELYWLFNGSDCTKISLIRKPFQIPSFICLHKHILILCKIINKNVKFVRIYLNNSTSYRDFQVVDRLVKIKLWTDDTDKKFGSEISICIFDKMNCCLVTHQIFIINNYHDQILHEYLDNDTYDGILF